jgi:hypothetical protein
MRLRLTKVDEYQFLTCVKHSVWGSKVGRFKDWQPGDYLAIIVDKAIAGLARVVGPPYVSDELVWDNGTFPHRIPLEFVHVMQPANRPPILGQIRDAITSAWGVTAQRYGWGILNQRLIANESADVLVKAITACRSDLPLIRRNLDQLLEAADQQRAARRKPAARAARLVAVSEAPNEQRAVAPVSLPETEPTTAEEESEHASAQSALIELGRISGCSVWIASNDRNRAYRGKPLGDGCLRALPNLGLSREATTRIALIDVIWVRDNAPLCAFEVETTTTVYSGLLRMSDLLALVPAIKIQLFIVAPRVRQAKVMDELTRPTFDKIGLSDYCRFIATEDLDDLLKKVAALAGHIQPTILDTVAVAPLPEPTSVLE